MPVAALIYSDPINIKTSNSRDSGTFRCFLDCSFIYNTDNRSARLSVYGVGIEQNTPFTLYGAPVYIRLDSVKNTGLSLIVNQYYTGKSSGASGTILVEKTLDKPVDIEIPRKQSSSSFATTFTVTMGSYADGTVVSPTTNTYTVSMNIAASEGNDIIFRPRAGSTQLYTAFKYKDEDYIIPPPRDVDILAMTGFQFTGWATSLSDQTVRYVPGDVYSQNKDLELIGVWRKNVDVVVTAARSDRVSETGSYDDTSTYARTTAVVDVQSIWETETRISITAIEANVDVQTEPVRNAATIFPSNALTKPADQYSSRTSIVWDSIDDAIEFTADKAYDVQVKADVYKINEPETIALSPSSPMDIYRSEDPIVKSASIAGYDPEYVQLQSTADYKPYYLLAEQELSIDAENEIARVTYRYPDDHAAIPSEFQYTGLRVTYSLPTSGVETFTQDIPFADMPDFTDVPEYIDPGEVLQITVTPEFVASKLPEGAVFTLADINITEKRDPSVFIAGLMQTSIYINSADNLILTVTASDGIPGSALIPSRELDYTPPYYELVASANAWATLIDAEFVLDFHTSGKGMAIGGIAPESGLEIGWDTNISGTLDVGSHLGVKENLLVDGDAYVYGNTELDGALGVAGDLSVTGKGAFGNRKDTMWGLAYLGQNPTGGTGNDTRAFWKSRGTGVADINATGQLNGQPYQYGYLINIAGFAEEVQQIFISQPNGHKYYRGVNGNTSNMPSAWYSEASLVSSGSYPGLLDGAGATTNWIRTTTNGFIPATPNATSGASALGTSGWPFASAYIKNVHAPTLSDVTTLNGKAIIQYVRDCIPGYVLTGWGVCTLNGGSMTKGATKKVSATITVASGTTHYKAVQIAQTFSTCSGVSLTLRGTTATLSGTLYNCSEGTHNCSVAFLVIGSCSS